MRSLSLLLLALCACSGLSTDEQQQLTSIQRNARLYFDGGRLDKAFALCERGLELAPEDYVLRSMRAAIYLRQSPPATAENQRALDASLAEFAEVYAMRSPTRQDRHVLFYYALARQKQGLRLSADASRQIAIAAREEQAKKPEAAKAAHDLADDAQRRAEVEFDAATAMLQLMLERGEVPRLCHFHLMQLAAVRGRDEEVLVQGRTYLEQAAKDREAIDKEIERTTVVDYEAFKKRELEALRTEEIEVRSFVADRLYDRKQFEPALDHINALLALDSTRSIDHYNRARILAKLGRGPEAKEDLRKFLATTSLPAENEKVREAAQALAR